MITINVARDFTRYPSGRYKSKGDTSGEAFRERFLEEPLREGKSLSVELDGTIGYGSSFLEEAFGGLIRSLRMTSSDLRDRLNLVTLDPILLEEVNGYIDDAGKVLR